MTAERHVNAERLDASRRLVIKVGSALFVDAQSGTLDRAWLVALCEDVAALRSAGKEVVIVSSGAVALGVGELGLDPRRARLDDKQAAAAAGQIRLAHAYSEVLGGFGIKAAQVLLTIDDSESRKRYLNASRTLLTLLRYGAVPVVNENDTVATQELRYGDNDRLAARVAQMVTADCLVLLSDVDGLYTADPRTDAAARHIGEVTEVRPELWDMAGGPGSSVGSGGMRTKLDAARIAVGAGCRMCIASGRVAVILEETRTTLATIERGGYFGEMSLLTGDPRTASVIANGDVRVLEVDAQVFRQLGDISPQTVEQVGVAAATRRAELMAARSSARSSAVIEPPANFLKRMRKFLHR